MTQVALRKLRGQVSRYVEALSGQIDTESCIAPKTRRFSNTLTEVFRYIP